MSKDVASCKQLAEYVKENMTVELSEYLSSLDSSDIARAVVRLDMDDQVKLLGMLDPESAADIIEGIPELHAVEVVEEMPTEKAVAILEELESDHLVDVLGEMDDDSSRAILDSMSHEDAVEARMMMEYPTDCAGGIMISEYLSFSQDSTINDVLEDLQANQEEYADYNVQYFYVVDEQERLTGVLRVHDLLFPPRTTSLKDIMITTPLSVADRTGLTELDQFFEEHTLFGVPVVDEENVLIGIVLPDRVEEAINKRKTRTFLRISGIIGGEEFRTMPLLSRSGRRLAWLTMNIGLNIIAASVIALYQDTLAAVITLAVFLPMVSDMSGCSGNQAVAVSMRELALGLIRPGELLWVLLKELRVGLLNGLILGLILGSIAFLWKGNVWLAIVIGGALAANTLVSVLLGGMLPLLLKGLRLDPALVSSPLLTTVTDMCGFFFVLNFAAMVLPKLQGV